MGNIQDFYNRWKKPYHLFSSNPVANKWRDESIESMNLSNGDKIADIGCGTGANVPIFLNNIGHSGEVVCVDLSKESLQMIRDRKREMDWSNVHVLNADATSLPLKNIGNYYASFSIGMFPNTLATVRGWCKDLQKGSTLCLLNVVRGNSSNTLFEKSMDMFTGLSVPASLEKKIELSVNGDGLDRLNEDVRSVHDYLRSNHTVVDEQERLDGYISWVTAEIN